MCIMVILGTAIMLQKHVFYQACFHNFWNYDWMALQRKLKITFLGVKGLKSHLIVWNKCLMDQDARFQSYNSILCSITLSVKIQQFVISIYVSQQHFSLFCHSNLHSHKGPYRYGGSIFFTNFCVSLLMRHIPCNFDGFEKNLRDDPFHGPQICLSLTDSPS